MIVVNLRAVVYVKVLKTQSLLKPRTAHNSTNMAESVNTVCVKCKLNHQYQSDNIFKCHGGCETFIRYVCSAYKPTELRLFEAYNQNIKWFYNMYAKEHEVLNVNDLHSKILGMDKKKWINF